MENNTAEKIESEVIVMSAIEINSHIDHSFSGSLSTGILFDHFSTLTTVDEYHLHYVKFCFDNKGWKTQGQISGGKSNKACGVDKLLKHSAFVLLSELALWREDMKPAEFMKLCRINFAEFKNEVYRKCFVNCVVFNNLKSYKVEYLKKRANEILELVPNTDEPEIDTDETNEVVKPIIPIETVVVLSDNLIALRDVLRVALENGEKLKKAELLEIMLDVAGSINDTIKAL